MTILWQETFTYANSTSPTTLTGGRTGSGGVINVQSNALSIKTGTSVYDAGEVSRRVNLGAQAAAEISGTYTPKTGNAQIFSLRLRGPTTMTNTNGYRMVFDMYYDKIVFMRDKASVATELVTAVPFAIDFNVPIHFRFQVIGSVVKAKAWTGATEPETWNVNHTDPSPYTTAGSIGFSMSAGNNGATATLDDLVVTDGAVAATANAGSDITVNSDQSFSLTGSATGTTPAYSWSIPGMKSITGATTLNPSMVAPIVGVDTNYTATLTVTPSGGTAVTDTATITVKGTGLYGHTPAGASIAYVWK